MDRVGTVCNHYARGGDTYPCLTLQSVAGGLHDHVQWWHVSCLAIVFLMVFSYVLAVNYYLYILHVQYVM